MNTKTIVQLSLCLIITTVLALTAHIYISEWTQPFRNIMMQGHQIPDSTEYSSAIITAAYGTAFITMGLLVFLWYHTQHLLPIKSSLLKALLLTCILLELKGNLIRQPVMDIIVSYSMGMKGLKPFSFVGLSIIDQWASSLLQGLSLVYLCPQKHKSVI